MPSPKIAGGMVVSRPVPSEVRASAATAPRCLTLARPPQGGGDDLTGRATVGVGDEADAARVELAQVAH